MRVEMLLVALAGVMPAACGNTGSAAADLAAAKVEQARMQVKQLAHQAYPVWAARSRARCPATLDELLALVDNRDPRDPWGHAVVMLCGEDAPAAANGFGVVSLGPDGARGTADDVTSW